MGVLHLKRALHDRGCLAPIFQKICSGTELLEEQEKLVDHIRLGEPFALTLVVSLDEINQQLQSTSARTRVQALNCISNSFCSTNSSGGVIDAVTLCLEDPSASVRRTALNALCKLEERGDERVIAEVIACLDDDSGLVREWALSALGQLLQPDDQRLQEAVEACLNDAEGQVRCSALHKIEEVIKEHDCSQQKMSGKGARGWQNLVEGLLFG